MGFIQEKIQCLLENLLGSYIQHVIKDFKDNQLKKKITITVKEDILRNCKDDEFFNELDKFLEDNKVISDFIRQCYLADGSKNIDEWINQLVDGFLENNTKFIRYRIDITKVIKSTYEKIFDALNAIEENEQLRVMNNLMDAKFSDFIKKIYYMLEEITDKNKRASDYQLGEVIDVNERERIEDIKKTFIETTPYKTALENLKNSNIILLVGKSGIGKSNTSHMLANAMEGYSIQCITKNNANSIQELIERLKGEYKKKEVIILDDFLGATKLDESEEYVEAIQSLLEQLKGMPNKKIILNSRKTIFENLQIRDKTTTELFELYVKTVDLDKWDNIEEKFAILIIYVYKYNILDIIEILKKDYKLVYKIIEHTNFTPLLIDRALYRCQEQKLVEFANIIVDTLDNPKLMWKKEVKALNQYSRIYLIILWSLSDTFISKDIVDKCYQEYLEKSGINRGEVLDDTVRRLNELIITDQIGDDIEITFKHPSIIDYLDNEIEFGEKENICKSAVYIEQIERTNDKELRKLIETNKYFNYSVLPVYYRFKDTPHAFQAYNSIALSYLKNIYNLKIDDKQYEHLVLYCMRSVLDIDYFNLVHASNSIINIFSLKYNLDEIINDKGYVEKLYEISNSQNIWRLIELTEKKDGDTFDFNKMQDYVQNAIREKLERLAIDKIIDYIDLHSDELIDEFSSELIKDGESDIENIIDEVVDNIIYSELICEQVGQDVINKTLLEKKLDNVCPIEIYADDDIRSYVEDEIYEKYSGIVEG